MEISYTTVVICLICVGLHPEPFMPQVTRPPSFLARTPNVPFPMMRAFGWISSMVPVLAVYNQILNTLWLT